MKLLILGGTRFLGPALVREALDRGVTVTLFNRGRSNPHLFPELEKLRGDRDGDLKALEGRSWDAVIDTSGYVPRIVSDSANLLADAVKQYVFISTLSVYRDREQPGIDESYPVAEMEDPTDESVRRFYGPLKALCEQAAEKAMPGRVTNLRPGLIVGPEDNSDRFTYWPVRVARGGEVLAPGRPVKPVQVIDARDLARFALDCIEQGHAGVYNCTGPDYALSMQELLHGCKCVAGVGARFTWVDDAFLVANQVRAYSEMPLWVPDEAGAGRGK